MAVYSQEAYSNLTEQCILKVPIYTKPIIKGNPNNLPIHITAKNVIGKYPHFIEYKGNVNIQQGNQTLIADEVKLTQKKMKNQKLLRKIVAIGNVHYENPEIILKGTKASSNLNNKDTDIEKADYFMLGYQGRGYANKIKFRGKNRYTILEKGMFTTCPKGTDSWNIFGSKVIFDREEELTKIWNAYFRISNMSIFYSPYLQLPIGNKRRSGLLFPNGSYSKGSGLDFSLPFYLNIAPNYDATITPELMTFRGIKLNNEFRYLTIAGSGIIAIDFLKQDYSYIKDKNNGKHSNHDTDDRWLLYFAQSSIFNQVWRFNTDYIKVSDSKYFTDFTSKYGNSTDGYVTQKFSFGYTQPNWNATLTHKKFQTLIDSTNSKVYKIEPQLDLNFHKNYFGIFNLKTYAQVAIISSIKGNNPDTIRLHIEPELNLPLSNNLGSINNIVKIMVTHYNQDIVPNLANNKLKKYFTRILPSVTSDIKLYFEHEFLKNSNYVQTLEPRIQYRYIPYRDQSNINNYDSSLLQVDYDGLFRNYIYSGLDRIASSNQLTTGITMRIYNKELSERFNFSIGQIYYFEFPRTENYDLSVKDKSNIDSLLLAGYSYFRLTDKWGLRGGIQYDKRLDGITIGNFATEYRLDSDHLIQVNYRFLDRNYIQKTVKNDKNIQKGISQIGAVVNWHLSDHWGFIGSYYHDMKEKQFASKLISIQYSTCCWSINIGYERKIVGWQQENFSSEYDNKWSINLELKGLNNNYNFENQDILSRGILPYQQVFY